MNVVYESDLDKQKFIIASVFPFDYAKEFAIVVRPGGVVEIDGSASLDGHHARAFARAIIVASLISEGVRVDEENNILCESCEELNKMRRLP